MSDGCTPRFRALIDRAFVRGLASRKRRHLREHLATCESCRERWTRLASIDRRLGGPRLEHEVTEDIGRTVLAEAAARPARRRRWIALGASLAAASVVVLVLRRPPDSTLTPRGGASHGRTPGVRLFCITHDTDHVRDAAFPVSGGPVPELRCTLDDDLQLAYTTPEREGLTMVAFARRDSSMILYAPTSANAESVPLRADRIDEVIDWSTRLSADHRPGRYEVTVRYFEREEDVSDAINGRAHPLVELRATLQISATGGDDAH
jgi:hypothetical protein